VSYRCENFRCYQWGARLRERDVRPLVRLHDGKLGDKRICRACGRLVRVAPRGDALPVAVALLTLAALLTPALTADPWIRYIAALCVAGVLGYAVVQIAKLRSGGTR
jgi:hypothetical protein